MSKLREWIHVVSHPGHKQEKFKPLRLLIQGAAGTGKSILIKALVTTIRRIFGSNNAIHVMAPTGAAAFNVMGQTIHRTLAIDIFDANKELGTFASKRLAEILSSTVALIFDERSMISQDVLGAAEDHVASTAHNMHHEHENWGGIPIVIMVGDDYQLPPTNAPGAFDTMNPDVNTIKSNLHSRSNGCQEFRHFSTCVAILKDQKRQHKQQNRLKHILNHVKFGKTKLNDGIFLEKLRIAELDPPTRQKITEHSQTLRLYANKQPMIDYNYNKLASECSPDNPVAIMKARTVSQTGKNPVQSHFTEETTPAAVTLCRNCKVQICGKNFRPEWGLFNGSMGTVIDIIFAPNESPNEGNLPEYVIVDFPLYIGPEWSKGHKTVRLMLQCYLILPAYKILTSYKHFFPFQTVCSHSNCYNGMSTQMLSKILHSIKTIIWKNSTYFPRTKCWTHR